MMKVILDKACLLFVLLLISCSMNAQTEPSLDEVNKKLQGHWVNKEDSNWKLSFEKDKVVETYEGEVLGSYPFSLSNNSCDASYGDKQDLGIFLSYSNEEQSCFEVTSIEGFTLA
jgi:hypothetical protein